MKTVSKTWIFAAVALALPLSAQAHKAWLLPSDTVLSAKDPWITVDAAVSNDLLKNGLELESVSLTALDQDAVGLADVVLVTPTGFPTGHAPKR